MSLRNPARERLQRGELSLGLGIRISKGVEIAKILKTCGYDWLFLDLEHGAMTLDQATQIAVAALDTGISPIVRVPAMELTMATRALDCGAVGIVMPHVDTAEEAKEIVNRLKYPPAGHRSVGGGAPQFDFRAMKVAELTAALNAGNLTICMIETPRAVENADAIAAVPGVDVLLIGTNDLAAEMGIPGDFANPRIAAAYETVIAASKKHGKWPGMGGVYVDDLLKRYVGMGMRMILSGGDVNMLMQAATQRSGFLRGCL